MHHLSTLSGSVKGSFRIFLLGSTSASSFACCFLISTCAQHQYHNSAAKHAEGKAGEVLMADQANQVAPHTQRPTVSKRNESGCQMKALSIAALGRTKNKEINMKTCIRENIQSSVHILAFFFMPFQVTAGLFRDCFNSSLRARTCSLTRSK